MDKKITIDYIRIIKSYLKKGGTFRFNKSQTEYQEIDIACRFIARKNNKITLKQETTTNLLTYNK